MSHQDPFSHRPVLAYVSIAMLVCLAAAAPPMSRANPIPGTAVMVNVGYQPEILTRCEDVVQHTTDTGRLTFDVYYYPLLYLYSEGLGIESLTANFGWPAEWDLVQAYEPIGDGYGSLQPREGGYRLEWYFYDCQMIDLDAPLLFIGRFVLDVSGMGRFDCTVDEGVQTCFPGQGGEILEAGYGGARAGVDCSFCDQPCNLTMPSWAGFTPDELPIEAPQGSDAFGSFAIGLNDMSVPETISFETDVDWLDLEWSWVSYYEIDLDVTAHTGGLEPGLHSARVRSVTEDCTGCAWVRLTVLPGAQGIEEDPDAPPPEPADEGGTWGRIKALYR